MILKERKKVVLMGKFAARFPFWLQWGMEIGRGRGIRVGRCNLKACRG